MLRITQSLITLLVLASLILQILVILGNFNGLKNVNIIKVNISSPATLGGILGSIEGTIDNVIPDFFTMALFVICEGSNDGNSTCTRPSFGFRYNATGILGTLQNEIPDSIHKALAAVQEGVFIPSAIFCFILLCYNFVHQCSGTYYGCCRIFFIMFIGWVSLIFAIATFVVQIVAYNELKDGINKAKGSIFGGLFIDVVTITSSRGRSIWMSLAAFICLFFVCGLLMLNVCCFNSRSSNNRASKRERQAEEYEMGHTRF